MRGGTWRVVADEHLTYFDRSSLTRLLRSVGFTHIRVATTGLDVPILVDRVRSIGSSQDASGRPSAPSAGRRDRSAALADAAIEVANALLGATHLGDGMRATAERPDVAGA
jgi:hypothetical protein